MCFLWQGAWFSERKQKDQNRRNKEKVGNQQEMRFEGQTDPFFSGTSCSFKIIYIYTYTHIYIYTHTYIHTHTHTHICIQSISVGSTLAIQLIMHWKHLGKNSKEFQHSKLEKKKMWHQSNVPSVKYLTEVYSQLTHTHTHTHTHRVCASLLHLGHAENLHSFVKV